MNSRHPVLSFVFGFALVGVIMLAFSFAGSRSTSVESESASFSHDIVKQSPQASNGNFIEFANKPNLTISCSNVTILPVGEAGAGETYSINADVQLNNATLDNYEVTISKGLQVLKKITSQSLPVQYVFPAATEDIQYTASVLVSNKQTTQNAFCNNTITVGRDIPVVDPKATCEITTVVTNTLNNTVDFALKLIPVDTTITSARLFPGRGAEIPFTIEEPKAQAATFRYTTTYHPQLKNTTLNAVVKMKASHQAQEISCAHKVTLTAATWAAPKGHGLLDPRPYISALTKGKSIDQITTVLNNFMGRRYLTEQELGLNPKTNTVITTSFPNGKIHTALTDTRNRVNINPNLAKTKEQYRMFAHAFIEAWSRIPYDISSKMQIETVGVAQKFGPAYAVAGCYVSNPAPSTECSTTGIGQVFQLDNLGYAQPTGPNVYYDHLVGTVVHEMGHLFARTFYDPINSGVTGANFPVLDNHNPPWSGYGQLENLRFDNGYPIGFQSKYGSTSNPEDFAEISEALFTRGQWLTANSRRSGTSGFAADAYFGPKLTAVVAEYRRAEPDLKMLQLQNLPYFEPKQGNW